ncbi:MAG: hypothetical protein K6F88_08895 [Ruminococcus sp.]|nr:hypothetical protein [Ruminococcus sp.]
MADFNEYVESLPDYNVFDDNSAPAPVERRRPARRGNKRRERSPLDYNDGFGIYVERKVKGHDYLIVFWFPILILWLEFSLRLGCGEDFGFNSIIYTGAFSMVFACVLTVICTFGGRVFNLVLNNLFTFILTIWFVIQLLYQGAEGKFMRVSDFTNADLSKLFAQMGDRLWIMIVMFLPFLFSVVIGWKVFTFRRIRIPAKISLILLAVLIQLSTATMISLSKNNPYVDTSYNLYNKEFKINESADRFGILTTQRLDITNMFTKGTKG